MTAMTAEDIVTDDRRRVVGAALQRGRAVNLAHIRASVDIGMANVKSTIIATRGERLMLDRVRFLGHDQSPEAFFTEILRVFEMNTEGRIAAGVYLDPDDIDAAFEELEARYLVGEGAAHAHAWSVIARTYAAFNRHEFPSTTPDSVYIDHRPLVTNDASDLAANVRATWELMDVSIYTAESVHRLSELGAVVTQILKGTSKEGLDVEYRMIDIFTVEGDLLTRVEVFDETDLDAALARFDELHPQARRLENAASRMDERLLAHFGGCQFDAIAEILADESFVDDRRRIVNAGLWQGRDAVISNMRALAGGANTTSTVVAIRGERLALARIYFANRELQHGDFGLEMLSIAEIDADNQIAAHIVFDPDDLGAAFAELDARYLVGEAAAHAHTWSVIARTYAAFNQHEFPSTTPDPVYIDHRPGVSVDEVDVAASIRAVWDLTPDVRICIEAVHRLSELGAVVTAAMKGTSPEGFDAEWQMIDIFTVEGDRLRRIEVFDEADLDAALARFDELHPQTRRLENAASRADDRFFARTRARNWAAAAEILADDSFVDDRRRVVNIGVWDGRDAVIANIRALAEAVADVTSTVIAIRGEHLALARIRAPNRDLQQGDFGVEMLGIAELDTDERIAAHVMFDLDDIDAAFEELDARYLAGEAAAHARAWSVDCRAYAGFNRHELPATTPDSIYIDHRPLVSIEATDLPATIRAVWDLAPDISVYIEAVHRLSELGAVVTAALNGTSQEGFDAEWRMIDLFTVEGDLISRVRSLRRGRPRRRARPLRGTAPAGAATGKRGKPSGATLLDLLRGPRLGRLRGNTV